MLRVSCLNAGLLLVGLVVILAIIVVHSPLLLLLSLLAAVPFLVLLVLSVHVRATFVVVDVLAACRQPI